YALQEMPREQFIKVVCDGLPVPPSYFFKDAKINITGYEEYDRVMDREMKILSIEDFKKEVAKGAVILDTRPADEFGTEFIKGAINIGLNGDFAVWAG